MSPFSCPLLLLCAFLSLVSSSLASQTDVPRTFNAWLPGANATAGRTTENLREQLSVYFPGDQFASGGGYW